MKKVITNSLIFVLILLFFGAACKKIDDTKIILEITPESNELMIITAADGIEFTFCLQDELGQPLTRFEKDKNIIFNFSIKNNLQDTIIISTEFINNNFFRVVKLDNNFDYGKPWTGVWCEFSLLPQKIVILPSDQKKLSCPWVLSSNCQPDYPLCMSQSKNYLPVGLYITSFDLDFHYCIDGSNRIINNMKFNIIFKIEGI
jgi:hypothetical protein